MSRNNQCCFCQKVLKAMHILTSLLVSSSDFLLIQYLSNSCKTWQNEGFGSITWNMQNGKNEDKKKGKTRNCQWPQIWNFSTSCMCVMWRMSPHKCEIYSVLFYKNWPKLNLPNKVLVGLYNWPVRLSWASSQWRSWVCSFATHLTLTRWISFCKAVYQSYDLFTLPTPGAWRVGGTRGGGQGPWRRRDRRVWPAGRQLHLAWLRSQLVCQQRMSRATGRPCCGQAQASLSADMLQPSLWFLHLSFQVGLFCYSPCLIGVVLSFRMNKAGSCSMISGRPDSTSFWWVTPLSMILFCHPLVVMARVSSPPSSASLIMLKNSRE